MGAKGRRGRVKAGGVGARRPTAVLLMAYGSAPSASEADVRAYLDHILGHYRGAMASDDQVAALAKRYALIGGSPLYDVTDRLAARLDRAINQGEDGPFAVSTAMKHSPPFIEEVVRSFGQFNRAIAVALAPFQSRLTTDGYYSEVGEATKGRRDEKTKGPVAWMYAGSWNMHPRFLDLWSRLIRDALSRMTGSPVVIFSNHSLPARILSWNDPYPEQFRETAEALADRLSLGSWDMAFQSEGGGVQPWLGPSLFEVVGSWINRGHESFLVAPIGFLMDHLEVRYDLDIVAKRMAEELEIELRRTDMPNDDPLFVEMLVEVVQQTVKDGERR